MNAVGVGVPRLVLISVGMVFSRESGSSQRLSAWATKEDAGTRGGKMVQDGAGWCTIACRRSYQTSQVSAGGGASSRDGQEPI